MHTLIEFNVFYQALVTTTDQREKDDLIKLYVCDSNIKKYLTFLRDPYITGITVEKYEKSLSVPENYQTGINSVETLLMYLQIHNKGTPDDYLLVQQFIREQRFAWENVVEDYRSFQELYKGIVTKSLCLDIPDEMISKALAKL